MCDLIIISPPLINLHCMYDRLLPNVCAPMCDGECTCMCVWPCELKCVQGCMWECVCLQDVFRHFCKNCCCNVGKCNTDLSSPASCMFVWIFIYIPPKTVISAPIVVCLEYCNDESILRCFLPSQKDCILNSSEISLQYCFLVIQNDSLHLKWFIEGFRAFCRWKLCLCKTIVYILKCKFVSLCLHFTMCRVYMCLHCNAWHAGWD